MSTRCSYLVRLLCLGSLAVCACTRAAAGESGFLKRELTVGGVSHGYRVYVPAGYDGKRHYPVVLYLHGSGDRGTDNETQIRGQLGAVILVGSRLGADPFKDVIAVFPQCMPNMYWMSHDMAALAMAELDASIAEFKIDSQRVYVTGFSMGGYGAWYLAVKYPERFAAMATVSSDIKPEQASIPIRLPPIVAAAMDPDVLALYGSDDPYAAFAKGIGKLPVWIFHGDRDDQVSVEDSRSVVRALRSLGNDVRYTEYPGAEHFIAEQAYTEPGFWTWLLAQRLRGPHR